VCLCIFVAGELIMKMDEAAAAATATEEDL